MQPHPRTSRAAGGGQPPPVRCAATPGQTLRRIAAGSWRGLLALALSGTPSLAHAEPATLRIELNRLEARDNGTCRVWFVASNHTAEVIEPLRLDLVLFGRDAVILRRLAVDIGPLPASRTSVRIFDVAGQACEGIGQLLLNDVLACGSTEPNHRAACADHLSLSSRAAGVEFHK